MLHGRELFPLTVGCSIIWCLPSLVGSFEERDGRSHRPDQSPSAASDRNPLGSRTHSCRNLSRICQSTHMTALNATACDIQTRIHRSVIMLASAICFQLEPDAERQLAWILIGHESKVLAVRSLKNSFIYTSDRMFSASQ